MQFIAAIKREIDKASANPNLSISIYIFLNIPSTESAAKKYKTVKKLKILIKKAKIGKPKGQPKQEIKKPTLE